MYPLITPVFTEGLGGFVILTLCLLVDAILGVAKRRVHPTRSTWTGWRQLLTELRAVGPADDIGVVSTWATSIAYWALSRKLRWIGAFFVAWGTNGGVESFMSPGQVAVLLTFGTGTWAAGNLLDRESIASLHSRPFPRAS